jgi:hypothetical protein
LVASSRQAPSARSWSRRTSAGGKRPSSSVSKVFPGGSFGLQFQDVEEERERRLLLGVDEP